MAAHTISFARSWAVLSLALVAGCGGDAVPKAAQQLIEQGLYNEAAGVLQQEMTRHPNNAQAHFLLANCLFSASHGSNSRADSVAITHYEIAERLQPHDPMIRYNCLYAKALIDYDDDNRQKVTKELRSRLSDGSVPPGMGWLLLSVLDKDSDSLVALDVKQGYSSKELGSLERVASPTSEPSHFVVTTATIMTCVATSETLGRAEPGYVGAISRADASRYYFFDQKFPRLGFNRYWVVSWWGGVVYPFPTLPDTSNACDHSSFGRRLENLPKLDMSDRYYDDIRSQQLRSIVIGCKGGPKVELSEFQYPTKPEFLEKWIPRERTYVPVGDSPAGRMAALQKYFSFLPDEVVTKIMQGYLAKGMHRQLAEIAIPTLADARWDWVLTSSGPACTVREETVGLTLTFEGQRLARWERAKTP